MADEYTPQQIAEAAAYWQSREGQAERLATRAARLHRLVKLDAPELIIESERQLVFKSLMTFPINEQGAASKAEIDRHEDIERTEVLKKAGYFDGPEWTHLNGEPGAQS